MQGLDFSSVELSKDHDIDVLHGRITSFCFLFAFFICIVITGFYFFTKNYQMLPGGIAGVLLCGSAYFLNLKFDAAGKILFILAANFLVLLSHQQFNGLIPTYVYFFATGTGALILFRIKDVKYIFFSTMLALIFGLITIKNPHLLGMSLPSLPNEARDIIIPVVWVTCFLITIVPPILLLLLSRSLHERIVKEQAERFHSARLHYLGQISAGVAHEINNPLAVVQGKTELLIEKLKLKSSAENSDILDDLAFIDRNCEHISLIVGTLQTYSRHSANDIPVKTKLRSLLEDTCRLMKQLLDRHECKLQLICDAEIEVHIVPSEIMQAVGNLISNAIDAVKDLPHSNRLIEVKAIMDPKFFEISVIDQGEGIPEAVKVRMFDPFYTTKDPGKGTGLGLSIVQHIVHRHHGIVEVRNNQKPTIFCIRIPQNI